MSPGGDGRERDGQNARAAITDAILNRVIWEICSAVAHEVIPRGAVKVQLSSAGTHNTLLRLFPPIYPGVSKTAEPREQESRENTASPYRPGKRSLPIPLSQAYVVPECRGRKMFGVMSKLVSLSMTVPGRLHRAQCAQASAELSKRALFFLTFFY